MRIKRGMYGLKQVAILVYEQLVKHLKIQVCYSVIGTNAIFSHKTQGKRFCLFVDDFGIKYHPTEDAYHILNKLR